MRAKLGRPRRRASSVKKTIGKPCAGNPQARFERGFCPFTDEPAFLKVKGQNLPMVHSIGTKPRGDDRSLLGRLLDCHARIREMLALGRKLAGEPQPRDEEIAELSERVGRYFKRALPM